MDAEIVGKMFVDEILHLESTLSGGIASYHKWSKANPI
jgi:hypothetical protein